MDVIIYTADPTEIDIEEIQAALEGAGYFVRDIEIHQR